MPNFDNYSENAPTAAYSSGQVSVTSTATLICTVPNIDSGINLTNGTGATVYLGGSAVTTSTGYPLAASASVTVPSVAGVTSTLYGIVSSTASTVSYLYPTP